METTISGNICYYNEYATKNLNPFNQEILKRIKNIEDCICENNDK